jgi:phage-related protein
VPASEVILYQDDDEERTVPLIKWLEEQPKKVQAKCQAYLKQLEDFGHQLRRPVADYLRDGIYELRPSYQGVRYRMLYFFPKPDKSTPGTLSKIVVVSHGVVKEGAVPEQEIHRAVERKKKFEGNPGRYSFKPTIRP